MLYPAVIISLLIALSATDAYTFPKINAASRVVLKAAPGEFNGDSVGSAQDMKNKLINSIPSKAAAVTLGVTLAQFTKGSVGPEAASAKGVCFLNLLLLPCK